MSQLKDGILNCLQGIKGGGRFLSTGTLEFKFPQLEVDKVGELSYPIPTMQAKALIKVAHKAPFGKGAETLRDNKVRSAWEIDSSQLTFNGQSWISYVKKIVELIKPDLGLEDYTISAALYKMLIYEKGDFFLPHKDSEKEKGMFGTLIIGLPSQHTGGELIASFDGNRQVADFSQDEGHKISYAAFYADCDHEIKPVTSGYRVCLVYNLIQHKKDAVVKLQSLSTQVNELAALFVKDRKFNGIKPHIVLLGHQYTPENFSKDHLKLNDRSKAEVLLEAAKDAGCYAKLCLVTSYIIGSPEYDGYYDDDDGYGDMDMAIMEENDRELYIRDWEENELPELDNVRFEEADLIVSFNIDDEEPLIKESTGYMGNYGPDIEHWYHYGAVMIWSPEANASLLADQHMECKMQWVKYFNQHPNQATSKEVDILTDILRKGPQSHYRDSEADYNAAADWIINKDIKSFFGELDPNLCQFYFTHIDAENWLRLLAYFPKREMDHVIKQVTGKITKAVFEQLLSVLHLLGTDRLVFSKAQIKKLPAYFTELNEKPVRRKDADDPALARKAIDDLFQIEGLFPQDQAWVGQVSTLLIRKTDPAYMNGTLVTALLQLSKKAALAEQTLKKCKHYLSERVGNKPQRPADWVRRVPFKKDKDIPWSILKEFLESPKDAVYDYKARQHDRGIMEDAVNSVAMDIKMETIKKGSPQTLRLTKTNASYQRALKQWQEDVDFLDKIKENE